MYCLVQDMTFKQPSTQVKQIRCLYSALTSVIVTKQFNTVKKVNMKTCLKYKNVYK